MEREALAIVRGIHHYRLTMIEQKIKLITTPFTKLTNMQDSRNRLGCWALDLHPFDFMVTPELGTVNKNADGLSREWHSLTEKGEMSGMDILTDLMTLPASGSLKNTVQVLLSWQSPVSEGWVLINKKDWRTTERTVN